EIFIFHHRRLTTASLFRRRWLGLLVPEINLFVGLGCCGLFFRRRRHRLVFHVAKVDVIRRRRRGFPQRLLGGWCRRFVFDAEIDVFLDRRRGCRWFAHRFFGRRRRFLVQSLE